MNGRVDAGEVSDALLACAGAAPVISDEALDGLKFSEALPREMAARVLIERMTDPETARAVAAAPLRLVLNG